MNKLLLCIFSIIALHNTINACSSCITQVSQKDKHFATRTIHSVKKAECNCQCRGKRSESGKCLECNHHIASQSLLSFKSLKRRD